MQTARVVPLLPCERSRVPSRPRHEHAAARRARQFPRAPHRGFPEQPASEHRWGESLPLRECADSLPPVRRPTATRAHRYRPGPRPPRQRARPSPTARPHLRRCRHRQCRSACDCRRRGRARRRVPAETRGPAWFRLHPRRDGAVLAHQSQATYSADSMRGNSGSSAPTGVPAGSWPHVPAERTG